MVNDNDHMKTDIKLADHRELENQKAKDKNGFSCLKLLEILISLAIPVALTTYTILQDKRQSDIARENRVQDADLANRTRWNDLYIADENLKDSLLNSYHDFLAGLLERHGMNLDKDPAARMIARFKILAVLKQLDSKRSVQIIRSLHESDLIKIDHIYKTKPIIDLSLAMLHGLNLSSNYQNFQRDFSDANLAQTDLTSASFQDLSISGSHFDLAFMNGADLTRSRAFIKTCFFRYTSFRGAWLMGAKLIDAHYSLVIFDDATIKNGQMQRFSCDGCSFRNTDLSQADLSDSVYSVASCDDQHETTKKIEITTFESTFMSQGKIDRSTFIVTTFYNVTFMDINGSKVTFRDCSLNFVQCLRCRLNHLKMNDSELSHGQLTGSDMSNGRIYSTTFQNVSMDHINLTHTIFFNCTFYHVNFTNSIFDQAIFRQCHFNDSFIHDDQWKQILTEK